MKDFECQGCGHTWQVCDCAPSEGFPASFCSPDVVSWDRWKQTLDELDEARREIERVKRLVRMLDDSPKSLLNHLVSWANAEVCHRDESEL